MYLICSDQLGLNCLAMCFSRRVLGAHSSFFSSVLPELGPDAVVYLQGLDSRDLTSVMDLLYLGRATVATFRVEHLVRCLEGLQVPGPVIKEEAQELHSLSSNCDMKDFEWSISREASEEAPPKEGGGSEKKLKEEKECSIKISSVKSLTDTPQFKEEKQRQTSVFSYHNALKQHVKFQHGVKEEGGSKGALDNKCDVCCFTAKTKISLGYHKAYKHDSRRVRCDLCSELFLGRLKMMIHKRKVHGVTKQCLHCGSCFKTNSLLKSHINSTHTKETQIEKTITTCLYCAKATKNIKRHLQRNRCDKPEKQVVLSVKCDRCDKTFSRREHMRRHMRSVHDKIISFACILCDYMTYSKFNLKVHMTRTHNGLRPRGPYKHKALNQACPHCLQKVVSLDSHLKKYHNKKE